MIWLAVIVGGLVGAPARYLLDRTITARVVGAGPVAVFPWALLVVNVLGSAIAGLVITTTEGSLRVLLLAGFCGAFTTFSGYAWETHRLWDVSRRTFWASVVVMPVACVAAFLLTWTLSGSLS